MYVYIENIPPPAARKHPNASMIFGASICLGKGKDLTEEDPKKL